MSLTFSQHLMSDLMLMLLLFLQTLIMDNQRWYMPRLLELPTQYDTIFQHYRNRKCPQCSRLPAAPSICLICGTFICCRAHSGVAVSVVYHMIASSRLVVQDTFSNAQTYPEASSVSSHHTTDNTWWK